MSKEEIEIKKVVTLKDGKHKGNISLVTLESRKTYDYVDLFIALEGKEELDEIKTGFPASISELSSLGELLTRAGMKIDWDAEKVTMKDIKNKLEGRTIDFLTTTNKNGFSDVVNSSIKFVD